MDQGAAPGAVAGGGVDDGGSSGSEDDEAEAGRGLTLPGSNVSANSGKNGRGASQGTLRERVRPAPAVLEWDRKLT